MRTIVIEDSEYEVDRFYREGVSDMQRGVPYSYNPYRHGSKRHDQWNYGHENESNLPYHLTNRNTGDLHGTIK